MIRNWVQYSVWKEYIHIRLRSLLHRDQSAALLEDEATINRTETSLTLHILRAPRNIVLDETVVQQRSLPQLYVVEIVLLTARLNQKNINDQVEMQFHVQLSNGVCNGHSPLSVTAAVSRSRKMLLFLRIILFPFS